MGVPEPPQRGQFGTSASEMHALQASPGITTLSTTVLSKETDRLTPANREDVCSSTAACSCARVEAAAASMPACGYSRQQLLGQVVHLAHLVHDTLHVVPVHAVHARLGVRENRVVAPPCALPLGRLHGGRCMLSWLPGLLRRRIRRRASNRVGAVLHLVLQPYIEWSERRVFPRLRCHALRCGPSADGRRCGVDAEELCNQKAEPMTVDESSQCECCNGTCAEGAAQRAQHASTCCHRTKTSLRGLLCTIIVCVAPMDDAI